MAIRARPADLLRLVVRQGLALTVAGAVAGLAGALTRTGYLRKLLFRVTPTDPLTFAATPLLFVAIALLACSIPARRAMRSGSSEGTDADGV
jgi:putative ABC transport system permease protein